MTTSFGVTPSGFNAPTVQELIALFQQDQLSLVSAQLDVSADSIIGQINGIFAFYLAEAWEAARGAYDSFDPDKAEDAALTVLSKLTGTQRSGATQSSALCTIVADPGTVLLSGTHFASVLGKPDVKFTPQVDFTAVTGSTVGVTFVSENAGPIPAPGGTLTVIATPVVGWTSITNFDARLGSAIASDSQLRLKRQQELTHAGSSTIDAITAKLVVLLDSIAGSSVAAFNNVSDASDANGLPPHSFEMVVWDPTGTIADNTFAQVIWDNKPAGIRSYGTSSGNAIDQTGTTQVVQFSKATQVPIYVTYTLNRKPSYVSDAAFKDAVVLACSATDTNGNVTVLNPFATGVYVTLYDLIVATQGLGAQVVVCTFGTAPAPTLSVDVPIGIRQIATFDTSRITVI